MALDIENVVRGGVGGKEFMRGACAFEALHLTHPPSGRLMRVLGPIVRGGRAGGRCRDQGLLRRRTANHP